MSPTLTCGSAARLLLRLSLLLYFVSFFLPAYKILPDEAGWETWISGGRLLLASPFLAGFEVPLAHAVFWLSLVLCREGQPAAAAAGAVMAFALTCRLILLPAILMGFYAWLAATMLLAAAGVFRHAA